MRWEETLLKSMCPLDARLYVRRFSNSCLCRRDSVARHLDKVSRCVISPCTRTEGLTDLVRPRSRQRPGSRVDRRPSKRHKTRNRDIVIDDDVNDKIIRRRYAWQPELIIYSSQTRCLLKSPLLTGVPIVRNDYQKVNTKTARS